MTKIKILSIALLSTILNSCQVGDLHNCNNFRNFLNLDSSFVVNLNKHHICTTKELIDYVISEKCNRNNNYTGTFEIYFTSLDENNSSGLKLKDFKIRFLGYLCPNSLLDFSYNDMNLNVDSLGKYYLENEHILLDSIGEKVEKHLGKSLVYNENSRIIINTLPYSKLLDNSSLISGILSGYNDFLTEQSVLIFSKNFCELSNNELTELKKILPLNLSIIYEDYRKPK